MNNRPPSAPSLIGGDFRSVRDWPSFINDGSSTAPAFCLLMLTTDTEIQNNEVLYHVKQPDHDGVCGAIIAINGPCDVPAGDYGQLMFPSMHAPGIVKLNSGSAVFGNLLGAKANQWLIDNTRAGFTVIGDAGNNRAIVVPGPFTLRGKQTGSTWNVDTDADVNVWQGRDTGAVTSPAVVVNVRNRVANITAAGDACFSWEGSQWHLESYRCPGI